MELFRFFFFGADCSCSVQISNIHRKNTIPFVMGNFSLNVAKVIVDDFFVHLICQCLHREYDA